MVQPTDRQWRPPPSTADNLKCKQLGDWCVLSHPSTPCEHGNVSPYVVDGRPVFVALLAVPRNLQRPHCPGDQPVVKPTAFGRAWRRRRPPGAPLMSNRFASWLLLVCVHACVPVHVACACGSACAGLRAGVLCWCCDGDTVMANARNSKPRSHGS